MSDKLSVIIPARNEKLLQKTVECVLAAAVEDIEVIAICDGYWPEPQVLDHPNVVLIHHSEARGQRQSINEGAKIAAGKYIMKLDAHCNVAEGFDKVLKEDCKYEWTMVPRMYNLDVTTFEPKKRKLTDYMYISSPEYAKPFRAMYYGNYEGAKSKAPRNKKLIDETMCCMGPGWFMHKDRFWELGGCDEDHGGWGQQGVEVALKAWLSGGALMVNKRTWFSHWFRGGGVPDGFDKGFPYSISGKDVRKARKHSQNLWLNNKWPQQTRTLEWLVEKFNPPTWNTNGGAIMDKAEPLKEEFTADEQKTIDDFYTLFHRQWNKYPRKWLGTKLIKYPTDMFLYQMIIHNKKPDFIIETGTYIGGGTKFFASMCDLVGHGQVISIDKRALKHPKHPRITYITGRATDPEVLDKIREMVGDGSCMVVLDSDHRKVHVQRELSRYSKFVTKDQYLVAEDTMLGEKVFWRYGVDDCPKVAVEAFMKNNKDFVVDPLENRYMISMNPGGWLRRVT